MRPIKWQVIARRFFKHPASVTCGILQELGSRFFRMVKIEVFAISLIGIGLNFFYRP